MANRAAIRRAWENEAAQRESGVFEMEDAPADPDPRARIAALFRAEGAPLLAWVTRRVPAQAAVDLCAMAFLTLVEIADRRGDLHGDPADLLYYLAFNEVRNHRRAQRRLRQRDGGDETDAIPDSEPDLEQAALAAEEERFVADLLAEISAEDAALIRSVDMDGAAV
jgi:DNA-directed RNA polymerase specialized sigma24 family protein